MDSRVRSGLAILGVVLVLGLAYTVTPALFDLDDAYISLHGGQVALDGADPIFGAPALEGATSPVYVAMIMAALAVGMNGLTALRVVTAAGLAAYVFALWRLGRAMDLAPRRRLIVAALTLGSGLVLMQATNGLETGWALALLTFLIAESVRQHAATTSAGAALLPFLRPELAPAAAAVVLHAWRGQPWSRKAACAAIALVVAAPIALWVHRDAGAWIPQTIQAKTLFFAESCQPLRLKSIAVYAALSNFLLMMAPMTLCAVTLPRERLGRYGLAAVAVTLAAFLIRFPGGLSHNYSRYVYTLLTPWLSLGVAARLARGGRLGGTPAVAVLLAAAIVMWPFMQPVRGDQAIELRGAAEWIDRNVSEGATILVHDAGAISVFGHHRAVDVVGLKTASSVEAHRRWTLPSCGRDRAKALAEIARASRASFFVVVADWDDMFGVRAGLEANGFRVVAVRNPSAVRGYRVYRIADSLPVT